MRELGDDRRIDGGIEPGRGKEDVDLRLNLARELLEHEVLVLHLGAELGRLEQALAVPLQRSDLDSVGGNVQRQSTSSHSFKNARSSAAEARTTSLVCSTRRLCSAWNTWWTAVRPMFSLTRPSPAMKCSSSSSSS